MIRSMTGYAIAEQKTDGYDLSVEIKGVNHRYLEINVRTPRNYTYLEAELKSFIKQKAFRGKIDVFVSITNNLGAVVNVDVATASAYLSALTELSENLGLKNDLTVNSMIRLNDVFKTEKPVIEQTEFAASFKEVLGAALDSFVQMREKEGEGLKSDIQAKLDKIEDITGQIETLSIGAGEQYRLKLTEKIKDMLGEASIDEGRILTEAAIFAEKAAIDEELVRLHSHLKQFRDLLVTGGTIGKTLDFICQEINREANTIGSKASDINISKLVIDIKSELEKIREQVQNIE